MGADHSGRRWTGSLWTCIAFAPLLSGTSAYAEPVSHLEQPTSGRERPHSDYRAARRWKEGDPAPPGFHLESRLWTGVIVGGAVPFGIFYGFGVMGAAMSSYANDSKWLFVPGIGPWIMALTMPDQTCHRDYDVVSCTPNSWLRGVLLFDGVVQSLGLTLIVVGATTERHRLVYDGPSVSLRPLRIGSGYGFGLAGEL